MTNENEQRPISADFVINMRGETDEDESQSEHRLL